MSELSKVPVGRFERVHLRDVWAREDGQFTPWLAQPANIEQLSKALHIDLVIEAGDKDGRHKADIAASDIAGNLVLIENQLDRSNHTRLGEIVTALAGVEAATVVWLASEMLDEHRAAIDWLNESTTEAFTFFGVEIELFRIDSSAPAPLFKVTAMPRDWNPKTGYVSGQAAAPVVEAPARQNGRQPTYAAYWSAFDTFLAEQKSPLRMRRIPQESWCGFGLGRTHFTLVASAAFQDRVLSTEIFIAHPNAKLAFETLESERAAIESEVGETLSWEALPDNKGFRIAIYRTDIDPADAARWSEQFSWLLHNLLRFGKAFAPRVRALQLDGQEGQAADAA